MKLAIGALLFLGFSFNAWAGIDVKSPQERESTYGSPEERAEALELAKQAKPCESFKEFKEAYEILVKDIDLSLGEERAARLALQISRGCNGSTKRFFKAYDMMKKTGVALTKAVEIGLDFVALEDDRVTNFNEVFSKMYLENVFDFDFATAYKVSFQLSRDYEGKAKDVREDFVKIVKFCTSNDKAALPLKQCAELGLKIVEYTTKFPGGLYSSFEKFYTFLRTDKRMGISVIESLNLVPKVFAYGPKAPENFIAAIEYALTSNKINIDHTNAMNLALRLAKQSLPPEGKEEFSEATTAKKK
jgi:hypothetical protein